MARVLVIEYDEQVLLYIRDVLEEEGITVMTARTARDGIKTAKAERPNLVISTFSLPEPERVQLLELGRRSTNHVAFPVVFTTSEDGTRLQRRWINAGASGFLEKPFLPEDLVRLVRRLLNGEE